MPVSKFPYLIYLKIIMSRIYLRTVQPPILINLCDTEWPCFTALPGVSVMCLPSQSEPGLARCITICISCALLETIKLSRGWTEPC